MEEPTIKDDLMTAIDKSRKMIGNMCSERRPPRMFIPAGTGLNWERCGDEDIYINQTLENCKDEIAKLKDEIILYKNWNLTYQRDNTKLERKNQFLKEALLELKIGKCWCQMTIDNPMIKDHSEACINAQEIIGPD